jgi:hypothetical protein
MIWSESEITVSVEFAVEISLQTILDFDHRPKNMIRKEPPGGASGAVLKRSRGSTPNANEQQIVISSGNAKEQGLVRTVTRTSGLEVIKALWIEVL